jgi:hypothetical protein
VKKPIGMIELAPELDIETVTEIFIRINSKGVVLSQADFAMSKIASDTENGGNELRKAIDYFCHLAIAPDFYKQIVDNDKDFAKSDFFQKMSWLKTENEDLYDPSYNDLIRVAFTSQFNRGRLSDLVSLLSGRNFETRSYETEIAEQSFLKLKNGVYNFINETNFKRFLMIVKSAGFISPKLIRSQNAINFAYIVYLKLKELGVFGDDYDTPDGTGVRDYIHVVDLALGHVKALKKIDEKCGLAIYNLGTGHGYSVLDIVKNFEAATGVKIPYSIKPRRAGDIATCYCDPSKAERELGWKAQYGIKEMCEDSWRWQKNNPNGYDD